MRRWIFTGLALAAATFACSDGPLASEREVFDFTVVAPNQIENKKVVAIEARIVDIDEAVYPLTFVFEKANVGEEFLGEGQVVLTSRSQRVARLSIPILKDPRIRVTARESSVREVTVSKTVRIDVLDFP
ncbi:MAG: hypothetical protein ABR527_04795 [Gemmatimonadota bacterium]|jgi:hypothetical protein